MRLALLANLSRLAYVTDTSSAHSLRRRLERQAAIPSALQTPGGGSSVLTPPKSPLAAPSDPSLAREFASSEFPAGEIDLSTLKQSLTDVDLSSSAMERLPDVRELDENFETAFQLAMNRGPLCAEPVVGMAYFLEAVELNPGEQDVAAGALRPSLAPARCRRRCADLASCHPQSVSAGRTPADSSSRRGRTRSATASSTGPRACSSRPTRATSRRRARCSERCTAS